MTDNIILVGVLFLGGFVGFLLGLTIQFSHGASIKLITAVLGAALGGAPIALMDDLSFQRWMYPIGLVIGVLWVRMVSARSTIVTRPKKEAQLAWYVAWADVIAIVGVTAAAVASAAFMRTEPIAVVDVPTQSPNGSPTDAIDAAVKQAVPRVVNVTKAPPAAVQWTRAAVGLCSYGGAAILNPRDVAVSGTVSIKAIVKPAASCEIDSVEFRYDCAWPNSGPSWLSIGSVPARSANRDGDVEFSMRWITANLVDGRGTQVKPGAKCQLAALVRYQDGRTVPNYSSFEYLPPQ